MTNSALDLGKKKGIKSQYLPRRPRWLLANAYRYASLNLHEQEWCIRSRMLRDKLIYQVSKINDKIEAFNLLITINKRLNKEPTHYNSLIHLLTMQKNIIKAKYEKVQAKLSLMYNKYLRPAIERKKIYTSSRSSIILHVHCFNF